MPMHNSRMAIKLKPKRHQHLTWIMSTFQKWSLWFHIYDLQWDLEIKRTKIHGKIEKFYSTCFTFYSVCVSLWTMFNFLYGLDYRCFYNTIKQVKWAPPIILYLSYCQLVSIQQRRFCFCESPTLENIRGEPQRTMSLVWYNIIKLTSR
jgi:hypothetical protein